jgi:hypothetical protein
LFRGWIGDKEGNRIENISRRTIEILLNAGVIKFVDGNYPHKLVKYELSK